MSLIQHDGRPAEALLQLARRHGIQVPDDVTARDLSSALQEHWIRKTPHQYQIPGGPPSEDDLVLLRELNLVDEIPALTGEYAGALVLGGTVVAVRKRIGYLETQYQNGARFTEVYLLGGARVLDPNKESPAVLTTATELPFKDGWVASPDLPVTEAGMMQLVFEQSKLPPDWKATLINAPLQPKEGGGTRDPNTTDTARTFLETNPPKGMYLVVSGHPYVRRQTLNIAGVLSPDDFTLVGIGRAAAPTTALKVFLDEVARLLFEQVALLPPDPTQSATNPEPAATVNAAQAAPAPDGATTAAPQTGAATGTASPPPEDLTTRVVHLETMFGDLSQRYNQLFAEHGSLVRRVGNIETDARKDPAPSHTPASPPLPLPTPPVAAVVPPPLPPVVNEPANAQATALVRDPAADHASPPATLPESRPSVLALVLLLLIILGVVGGGIWLF